MTSDGPGVLAAPPAGTRDFLYPESVQRSGLAAAILEHFASAGYDLAMAPPFEHSDVIERGLLGVGKHDLLRFVEPDTGEVSMLRPDITPQIARMVSSRFRERPSPWRIRYQGTVVRRPKGRARKQRQVMQVGLECVGWGSLDADVETISLAARAVEAVGLSNYRIELGQVRIAREALSRIPERIRDDVGRALGRKDVAQLASLLKSVRGPESAVLLALPGLYGGLETLDRAEAALPGASDDIAELRNVAEQLDAIGLAADIGIDLGDLKGMDYYTGVSFSILAQGPGEPVGAGGRYDDLLARFDSPAPATGCAIQLEHLLWALAANGTPWTTPEPARLLVPAGDALNAEVLRVSGAVAAVVPQGVDADQYMNAWGYDAHVSFDDSTWRANRRDGETLETNDAAALIEWATARRE